eukprot:CAMPEP_0194710610 /NCGR_PEP_ID=MMETSP0296-20130528/3180_1 /TAXON_ID=39354 /ORGANISM="Heterosigma akashiwo, Strain CCMP2393" /LENGTH=48 /DNA_ID= /DNA_START= /DNA_END= /DNA_ORIENTATION=
MTKGEGCVCGSPAALTSHLRPLLLYNNTAAHHGCLALANPWQRRAGAP